jgi:hypothetical protein
MAKHLKKAKSKMKAAAAEWHESGEIISKRENKHPAENEMRSIYGEIIGLRNYRNARLKSEMIYAHVSISVIGGNVRKCLRMRHQSAKKMKPEETGEMTISKKAA